MTPVSPALSGRPLRPGRGLAECVAGLRVWLVEAGGRSWVERWGVGEGLHWRGWLFDVVQPMRIPLDEIEHPTTALTATRHHADLTSDLSRKVVASDKA